METLRERLGHSPAAQAVLAHRGRPGAGAIKPAAGGVAFVLQGGHQHAGTKQCDPFAPQPRPRRYAAILHGDRGAMGHHDPGGELRGAGLLGLAGAARVGGMITAGAPITLRKCVVAVATQRHPIGAGMRRCPSECCWC